MRLAKRIARGIGGIFLPAPSIPSEERIKASACYRTRAPRRAQGWLILTRDDLIFERAVPWFSVARFAPSPNVDVAVGDIRGIEYLSGQFSDPAPFVPVLCVSTKADQQLFFQLVDIGDWIEALESVVRQSSAASR
jgi:hypothetical protein